jgi:hypothetical protein
MAIEVGSVGGPVNIRSVAEAMRDGNASAQLRTRRNTFKTGFPIHLADTLPRECLLFFYN